MLVSSDVSYCRPTASRFPLAGEKADAVLWSLFAVGLLLWGPQTVSTTSEPTLVLTLPGRNTLDNDRTSGPSDAHVGFTSGVLVDDNQPHGDPTDVQLP